MPDLWMDVDIALAEVPVNVMPLLDDGDFKSRETTVAYDAAGMDLVWNFVTTAGAFTQTAVTPTTAGDYDWTHQGDGMYTIEIPASGGASINNDTEGFGWFTGLVTGVLPWRGPTIGFRAAALNNALIDGGDLLDVNVTELGGGSQSATDLKDFADDGYDPSTNKVQGVVLTDTVTTYTGNTPQTGDTFARLGAPVGASISADLATVDGNVDSILADTNELQGDWVNGGRLDLILDARASQASVDTIDDFFDTEVAAILEDTGTTLPAQITALNNLSAAQVNAEVDTALSDYDPPTRTELTSDINSVLSKLLKYVQLILRKDAAIATDNSTEVTAINADGGSGGGTFANTTDSQEAIADGGGGGPTAADIADAVWEEAIADHSGTAGSTAEALNAAGSAGDPWVTALPGAYGAGSAGKIVGDNLNATVSSRASQTSLDTLDDYVDTEVAAIKAKTDLLTFTGSDLNTTLDGETVTVGTNNDKTGYTLSSAGIQAIWDALTSALTTVGSIGKLLVDNLNATISSRASQTSVDTIDDFLDTEVAAILEDTGTTIPAQITALNNLSSGDVQTAAAAALTAYDPPTNAELVSEINAVQADIAALNDLSAAQVNAEVVDALATDTYAELGSVPAATSTLAAKINWLFALARNKITQTSTTQTLRNDADSGSISTATVSDDGTTATRGEWQ